MKEINRRSFVTKSVAGAYDENINLRFNSKMVRLEADLLVDSAVNEGSFNSNMVRLEASYIRYSNIFGGGFQFQYGAIRSTKPDVMPV